MSNPNDGKLKWKFGFKIVKLTQSKHNEVNDI